VIWGAECDPENITQHTGLAPSKTWRVGDIRYEKTGKCHADSGWRVDSPEETEPTLDAHLEHLLNLLWPSRGYLETLRASCELQATVVIHRNDNVPSMSISAGNIARLATLNASIDIDVYPDC
jgi:hypothetical protein